MGGPGTSVRDSEIWIRQGGPEMVTFICTFCCECNEKVPRQAGADFRGSHAPAQGAIGRLANCGIYKGIDTNNGHKQRTGKITKGCFRRQAPGKGPQPQRTHIQVPAQVTILAEESPPSGHKRCSNWIVQRLFSTTGTRGRVGHQISVGFPCKRKGGEGVY